MFSLFQTEANLVSRLTSLSLSDLQRLFCKYFSKVVELRYNTKKLEAQVEDMEIRHDQVKRRVRKYQNDLREIEDENASVSKLLISFS
jgi:septal ring factor EnvC (AmiA/AmiB activator)